jgi:hypothetical protein
LFWLPAEPFTLCEEFTGTPRACLHTDRCWDCERCGATCTQALRESKALKAGEYEYGGQSLQKQKGANSLFK